MLTKEDTCTKAKLEHKTIEWDRDWKRTLKRRNINSFWPPYKETKE